MPKKRKRAAKLVSSENEEKDSGKGLRKRHKLGGSLTDSSNSATTPSKIEQRQQDISQHQQPPSSSRLSPYPVNMVYQGPLGESTPNAAQDMVYQGPLGESTPNAAQDIENSLFGFDWSTPLITSPSTVTSPAFSPIISESRNKLNALQDTPVSCRLQHQANVERRPKATTPKKRHVLYDIPVQPLKVNRNSKPRKKASKTELEEWMKKVNAEFSEIEKHELAVVQDKAVKIILQLCEGWYYPLALSCD